MNANIMLCARAYVKVRAINVHCYSCTSFASGLARFEWKRSISSKYAKYERYYFVECISIDWLLLLLNEQILWIPLTYVSIIGKHFSIPQWKGMEEEKYFSLNKKEKTIVENSKIEWGNFIMYKIKFCLRPNKNKGKRTSIK